MEKKVKRWAVLVTMAVGVAGIALNLLAYRHAHAMVHFTLGNPRTPEPEKLTLVQKAKTLLCGVNIPRPQCSALPTDLGADTRSLRLDAGQGVKLGAWYCPGLKGKPLVILFHGYSGEKSGTLPEARALLHMGMSVMLVDFRGSGESSESYTTVGFQEAEDVAVALSYARANLPHRKIVLYGQSMGAAAILRAVNSCGARPDGIMVEAVFDKMLNTVRHRFEAMGVPSFPSAELLVFWGGRQARFNAFNHNPVDYAKSVSCPILFLHGGADPRARIDEARRVFAAISAPKLFKVFPTIGHEASVIRFPVEWNESVGRFLKGVEPVDGANVGGRSL